MIRNPKSYRTCPIGIVLQRAPGVTKWRRWTWKATSVLPGVPPANWREIRTEGDITEYHAATLTLELHGAETEAYVHGLLATQPSIYVVMREAVGERPFDFLLVTASPYEAQDYTDSGEEVVEKVPMPPMLRALVEDFIAEFHQEEAFVKRKRDKKRVDLVQDGVGDPRIGKAADIYASPAQIRSRMQ
ncbi:MAG: DUF3305 domain-containing protein [Pseudomonadota bacterium]